jgi:hypothetical protein
MGNPESENDTFADINWESHHWTFDPNANVVPVQEEKQEHKEHIQDQKQPPPATIFLHTSQLKDGAAFPVDKFDMTDWFNAPPPNPLTITVSALFQFSPEVNCPEDFCSFNSQTGVIYIDFNSKFQNVPDFQGYRISVHYV